MAEKLYPVVYDFLIGCGYTKTASKCLKEIGKSEAKMKTSESLVKIYDAYLKKAKVAAKKVESSDDDSSDDDEESEDEKKKTIVVATKKVVPVIAIPAKAVSAPVKLAGTKRKAKEESSDDESESDSESEEEVAPKKKVKKEAVVESSESESEEESEDESEEESSDEEADNLATLARIKLKEEERKKKAIEASEAAAAWTQRASISPTPRNTKPKGPRVSGEAFRRVDDEIWSKEIIEGLEDNSYAKAFGVDGYGAKASEKLMTVRGKDFRHEKTKKKRGSYRGGSITMDSNSFKYD